MHGGFEKAGARADRGGGRVPELKIAEVDQILKDKSGRVVDANGADTRREYGVIPGAILLTDHKNYGFGAASRQAAELKLRAAALYAKRVVFSPEVPGFLVRREDSIAKGTLSVATALKRLKEIG